MNEQRNFILAIGLSIAVLLGWQYFIGVPQMEAERARQEAIQQGKAVVGMDKKAVLMAMGPPPQIGTASLEASDWKYRARRR